MCVSARPNVRLKSYGNDIVDALMERLPMRKSELSADWAFEYALRFAEQTHAISFGKSAAKTTLKKRSAKAAPKKAARKARTVVLKGKRATKK